RGEVRSGLAAAVGYGSGGRDAFRLATRNPDVMALVGFGADVLSGDGSAPMQAVRSLEAPLLLFFGEADALTPPQHIEQVRAALDRAERDHEIVSYAEAGEGFFRETGDGPAAESWTRAIDFLYERLEG